MNLFAYLRTFVRNEEGQDLLEYALLVALIAIICVAMVRATGLAVEDIFARISEELTGM